MSKLPLYIGLIIILAGCTKASELEKIDVENIQVAHWYEGKRCAFTFTFDDNTPMHKDIGDLLSSHKMKGSFYVNTGLKNFPDYKHIYTHLIKDGHEIGNHTSRHKNLLSCDSLETELQVRDGAEGIQKELGKYPLSFVHPYNATSDPVNNIVFKYHLFARIASPYNLEKRKIYDVNPGWPKLNDLKEVINTSDNYWIIIAGHGYGENDISLDFLEDLCINLENRDDVWVEKFSTVAAYDYLREELVVSKEKNKSTLAIKLSNFDAMKYRDLETVPITIKVPVLADDISLIADRPEVSLHYFKMAYYFSFDLKKINEFKILKQDKSTINET